MFEFTFVNFAIFNVADCFVTVGEVLLFIYVLFLHDGKKGEPDAQALDAPTDAIG